VSPSNAWVVRARREIARDVEAKSFLAIGWPEVGDVSGLDSVHEFRDRFRRIYAFSEARVANAAGQLYRFVKEMKEGDLVMTPVDESRELIIGRVTGKYSYDPHAISADYPNIRQVTWLKTTSRHALSPKLRSSSGSILTVFSVSSYLLEVERLTNR
jgi:restriction system protein